MQLTYKQSIENNGINYVDVEWEDSLVFDIPEDELASVVRFIERMRRQGKSVIVHCAQVSSFNFSSRTNPGF